MDYRVLFSQWSKASRATIYGGQYPRPKAQVNSGEEELRRTQHLLYVLVLCYICALNWCAESEFVCQIET
jgi:hypothetical protein